MEELLTQVTRAVQRRVMNNPVQGGFVAAVTQFRNKREWLPLLRKVLFRLSGKALPLGDVDEG